MFQTILCEAGFTYFAPMALSKLRVADDKNEVIKPRASSKTTNTLDISKVLSMYFLVIKLCFSV